MTVTVVQAKLVSMIVVGVGSFLVGIAPACFVPRVRSLYQKLFLSCTMCFGAGVLLATSILQLLPKTSVSLPKYTELLFVSGFFLFYLVDECVHYFWGTDDRHTAQPQNNKETWNRNMGSQMYQCRGNSDQANYTADTGTIRNVCAADVNHYPSYQLNLAGNGGANNNYTGYGAVQLAPSAPLDNNDDETTSLCLGNRMEPSSVCNTNLMGLLLALTVHAVLDGLAIGRQKLTSEIVLLAEASAFHKFVVGFCLGLEFVGDNSKFLRIFLAICVFSAGSVLGIGIGMITFNAKSKWTKVAIPILQGLIGGMLLYVTVSIILPRERARRHKIPWRFAGILQFVSVILGIVVIYLLNNYAGT